MRARNQLLWHRMILSLQFLATFFFESHAKIMTRQLEILTLDRWNLGIQRSLSIKAPLRILRDSNELIFHFIALITFYNSKLFTWNLKILLRHLSYYSFRFHDKLYQMNLILYYLLGYSGRKVHSVQYKVLLLISTLEKASNSIYYYVLKRNQHSFRSLQIKCNNHWFILGL